MSRGLILFAHGARDPAWAEPFEALAARVRALVADTPVRLAFLELIRPDLDAAAAELIATGVDAIRIVPIFFGQGGHLRRDLPERVAALRAKHSGTTFECAPAAGEDGAVLDAIARFCVRDLEHARRMD
ncbi:MAG TPA: CbiX/SirB N-terminal domain-containing protein [Casimicrobiaceae bacterium]